MPSTGDGVSRRRFLTRAAAGGASVAAIVAAARATSGFSDAPALIGMTRKAGRVIDGGFVFESHVDGHAWRDGVGAARGAGVAGDAGASSAGGAGGQPGLGGLQFQFPIFGPRRASVVIVGGGIAGLSAAWRLMRAGVSDVVVLELESAPGGNARFGENEFTAYPWGAHYVPLPGEAGGLVRELFADLGAYTEGGWDERHLVHAPRERLFIHGRWEDGLEPAVGPTQRDRDQIARFADRMRAFASSGAFTVPSAMGRARGPAPVRDDESMAAWMAREGFDSPWLRWQVDYACRDDYGALAGDVSAWAGVHYFAARNEDDDGPLTWPEGNGWVVRRLTERLGTRLRPSTFVTRVAPVRGQWQVESRSEMWRADAVVVATPWFIAQRLVDGWPRADVTYSPWLTANLTLDRWPRERGGGGPAWDNVLFDSPSLGYVVATHQHLREHVSRTVWTYYWALAQLPAAEARWWLLRQSWASVRDAILAELSRAHPDIAECVTRVDVLRLGHAMVRPTPGFQTSAARRGLEGRDDGLFYAHSDIGGLPLFEEALAAGVDAADGVVRRVTGRRG